MPTLLPAPTRTGTHILTQVTAASIRLPANASLLPTRDTSLGSRPSPSDRYPVLHGAQI